MKHRWLIAAAFIAFTGTLRAQPAPNPLGVAPTAEMVALGRELFFDKILSEDQTVSCSKCHDPTKGFTDGLPVSVGIRGLTGTINPPSILNAAHDLFQFRNGRTFGTATQALLPLENPREMGGRGNEAAAVARLQASSKYRRLFEDAFSQPPSAANLGLAIAAYETTLVTSDVLANRRLRGEKVLTPDAEVGFGIFHRVNCMRCHEPPFFTDRKFHNNGIDHGRMDVDQGRFAVTRNQADRRKWKTPSLIAVTRTAPYFHDGRAATLRAVLDHYNSGGIVRGEIDARSEILPLGLSETQISYLEKFLVEAMDPLEFPK